MRTSPAVQWTIATVISTAVPSDQNRVERCLHDLPGEMTDAGQCHIGQKSTPARRHFQTQPTQSGAVRKRSALPMTVIELAAMAALAIIGFSSSPNQG